MAELGQVVASVLCRLGLLLAVAMVAGAPSVAHAQSGDPGVLYACVHRDRRDGDVHGSIRIVLPNERCRRDEARFGLNVGGSGGGDAEYGAIHGTILSCLVPGPDPSDPFSFGSTAGSYAAVAGQLSLVVYTNGTGEFELSRVPPGAHELVLGVPGISEVRIVDLQVSAGQTTEVDPPLVVCFTGD